MNAILIPAYKPDMRLVELTNLLLTHEDLRVVVVDDGSGESFKNVFDALDERIHLISYPVNKGKGGALKTGIKHIYESMPECERLITADADGQHTYPDIKKVIEKSIERPGALVLGSRAFDGNVPFRSKFGNGLTRQVFSIATGVKVRDTQTGLRGFDREGMKLFLDVPGERYEYEINVLLTAARSGIPIHEVTIKTIYINENESSHFNPIKDSLKIYMCIFKFACSSLISFLIDWGLYVILHPFLGRFASFTIARLISASANFTMNRKVVFKGDEKTLPAIVKYAALAVIVYGVSYAILSLLEGVLHINHALANALTQFVVFLINFPVQGKFVFRKQKKG
ncbi:MAG: bifunctional glycosyltransferase family 2/GtrA family protein [Clostridia bacterium]|nr:glycosyltransferase [Clostridiales bacterium]MBQ3232602.1 bifunctional glycosyltransferase family 2/GtrA family protein [Clostridia bacterium]